MSKFADSVLQWYDEHGRKDLPWQQTPDAYRVWVSEIMLQQTQVRTVVPYYKRFLQIFPDSNSLANATLDDVLRQWSGLGYYARARNLHKAAQVVRDEHSGIFPDQFETVVALPGIGRSTAGAILSLALGQRHAILDGNVKRVLARHGAIAGWPGNTAVARRLWDAAERNTPDDRVAAYTQAIMDLGATICLRGRPLCDECPVRVDCSARAHDAIGEYPGAKPKKDKPLRKTTMVLAVRKDSIYLERRPAAGIWGGLWSLPEMDDDSVEDWCRRNLDDSRCTAEPWDTLRHSFSHYDLDIRPIVVRINASSRRVADTGDVIWYCMEEEPPGGIAAPVRRLIDQLRAEQHVTNS